MTSSARPRRSTSDYAVTALVLQGGGALGAYQGGVFQGLSEAGITPNWLAGISIGALNAAVIAGNPPAQRVERLRAFWETICRQPWWPPLPQASLPEPLIESGWRNWLSGLEAARGVMEGQNGFFVPRVWNLLELPKPGPETVSYYDTRPLRATLEEFADFDRINDSGELRVCVGAVNVRDGSLVYFDNTRQRLEPEHFMASGALPPGFPAIEIEGEYYWDGGLVSNTPLYHVLSDRPWRDSLIFQVDLWSAHGTLPRDLQQVVGRQKDIQYSSRTRLLTEYMNEQQQLRRMLAQTLALVPAAARKSEACRRAQEETSIARRNVIHLIYRDKVFENLYKDYEFSQRTLEEHWDVGLADVRRTLEHPEWLTLPGDDEPFVSHDVHSDAPPHDD